mgnify:CR=1 FL=1
MTFYVENETDETFSNGENSFPIEETVEQVATAVLDMEGCPYEIQLNVLLTDNAGRLTGRLMYCPSPIWISMSLGILRSLRTERQIILIRIQEN